MNKMSERLRSGVGNRDRVPGIPQSRSCKSGTGIRTHFKSGTGTGTQIKNLRDLGPGLKPLVSCRTLVTVIEKFLLKMVEIFVYICIVIRFSYYIMVQKKSCKNS